MAVSMRKATRRMRSEIIPCRVVDFCDMHNLKNGLRDAILLARRSFRAIKKLEARLQPDPDSNETRVVIDVTLNCTIPMALKMKRDYTRQWVKLAPPSVRDSIRLLYNLGAASETARAEALDRSRKEAVAGAQACLMCPVEL